MDRITIAAAIFAGASVVASLLTGHDSGATSRHAFMLVLPLAVIAFPQLLDIGFRNSWDGMSHGGEGPTPGGILRIGAWLLLIALVIAHHSMAAALV
jgi:hypothetical protein